MKFTSVVSTSATLISLVYRFFTCLHITPGWLIIPNNFLHIFLCITLITLFEEFAPSILRFLMTLFSWRNIRNKHRRKIINDLWKDFDVRKIKIKISGGFTRINEWINFFFLLMREDLESVIQDFSLNLFDLTFFSPEIIFNFRIEFVISGEIPLIILSVNFRASATSSSTWKVLKYFKILDALVFKVYLAFPYIPGDPETREILPLPW